MTLVLTMQHSLAVDQETAFKLWTEPEHLVKWWGPEGVDCISAELDLKVGGRYKLVNRLENNSQITIIGEYLAITRPKLLRFTWQVDGHSPEIEIVTVKFRANGQTTQIIVVHSKIPSESIKNSHQIGWLGCFSKQLTYITSCSSRSNNPI